MSTTAPFSFDEEVRLYTTNASREKYNLLATLFGIVVALDYLERAYVRDSITAVECVSVCSHYFPIYTFSFHCYLIPFHFLSVNEEENAKQSFIFVTKDTRQRVQGY